MPKPAEVLKNVGGIAFGTLLQKNGCSRTQLSVAARAGSIRRIRPGVYSLPSTHDDVVTAAEHGGALTCAAALRAHGIWVLPTEQKKKITHVWMGSAGRRHHADECGCVAHYTNGRTPLGLAPVAPALIHLYKCEGEEAFFAAYESAWNKRILSASARREIRQGLPKKAWWMLDLARSDSQSGLESLLRLRLHLLGIEIECQVEIPTVGRVDFVIGGRVILEADGKEFHTGQRHHADLMRDAASSALGYETLRFDYAMIIHNWDVVIAAILPALNRAAA